MLFTPSELVSIVLTRKGLSSLTIIWDRSQVEIECIKKFYIEFLPIYILTQTGSRLLPIDNIRTERYDKIIKRVPHFPDNRFRYKTNNETRSKLSSGLLVQLYSLSKHFTFEHSCVKTCVMKKVPCWFYWSSRSHCTRRMGYIKYVKQHSGTSENSRALLSVS